MDGKGIFSRVVDSFLSAGEEARKPSFSEEKEEKRLHLFAPGGASFPWLRNEAARSAKS
jgi:hypothetical protein